MAAPFSGTGYSNIQNIINANKDNQLGNTIQGGVQKGISGLQAGLNQSQQQFQTDVNNNNSQAQNQAQGNLVGSTLANISAPQGQTPTQQTTSPQTAPQQTAAPAPAPTPAPAQQASQSSTPSTTSQAAASGSPAAVNAQASQSANSAPGSFGAAPATPAAPAAPAAPANVAGSGTNTLTPAQQTNIPANAQAQIQQWAQGTYGGPTQLQNYATLQGQAQNLQQQGQQVNTPGGLQSLLQQYVGGPQYNRGEQTVDSLLLGQTGRPQLQNVLNSTQGLSNLPQTAEAQAAALAQQTAASNQAFGKDIQGQIQAAQNPILQQIQTQANTQNATNTQNLGVAQQIFNMLNGSAPNTGYAAAGTGGGNTPVYVPAGYHGNVPNNLGKLFGPGYTTTTGQQEYTGPGAYLGTTNTMPVANNIGRFGNGPILTGQTGLTGSSLGQADAALKLGLQNGFIDQGTANQLSNYLANQAGKPGGNTPQGLLQSALTGYTSGETAPQITAQQAATMQQAAQLSALQQLAGQTPTFNTYGGATAVTPSFNLQNIAGYNPNMAAPQVTTIHSNPNSGGGGWLANSGIDTSGLMPSNISPAQMIAPVVVPSGGNPLGPNKGDVKVGLG